MQPAEFWREHCALIMEPLKGAYRDEDAVETRRRRDLSHDVAIKFYHYVLDDMARVACLLLAASAQDQKVVEGVCYGLSLTVWRAVRAQKAYRSYCTMLQEPADLPVPMLAIKQFAHVWNGNTVDAMEDVLAHLDPCEEGRFDSQVAAAFR